MSTTLVSLYRERKSAAIGSVVQEMNRLGAGNSGALGNDLHRYGYHLSPARLRGTGQGGDYSLAGSRNRVVDDRAGCAVDIQMNWPAARRWVAWVRTERAAGRLTQVSELIGSVDGKTALYAADSTGWRWTYYLGSGHVAWAHVAHYRSAADDTLFGARLLGAWDPEGANQVLTPTPPTVQEDDMAALLLYRVRGKGAATFAAAGPDSSVQVPNESVLRDLVGIQKQNDGTYVAGGDTHTFLSTRRED